jgi:hypothetical protein
MRVCMGLWDIVMLGFDDWGKEVLGSRIREGRGQAGRVPRGFHGLSGLNTHFSTIWNTTSRLMGLEM